MRYDMIPAALSEPIYTEVNCPNCGEPVSPNHRTCDYCGVDVAVAALLAEQQAMLPIRLPQGVPASLEVLIPRIGDYLIEQGLVETSQLKEALSYQDQRSREGQPVLLGQALLELGMISRETLDQVIAAQILQLQNLLSEANRSLKQRIDERTRELRQALEQLSELNHLKSNFVANISHELRTPLTHIKGYLDVLNDGGLGALNEDQLDALSAIKTAEERLDRLIEDLIQFSLASRADLTLNLRQIAPGKLIMSAVERGLIKARLQDIKLKVRVQPDLPCVTADEDKVGWVLLQLLDNALKFTPRGGQVAMRATATDNGSINFSVIDTGIGIPEDRISEIFEPFHQLDGSPTRRYSGTGLGLAMVRKIVKAHGSQIKVRSLEGKGSRFEFDLPIDEAVPAAQKQTTR
jgi:signal transduction histidine kinase